MKAFLISFAFGALVGILYASLKIKSPAPPLVALAGLLGMLLAESAWPYALNWIRLLYRR
jgi:XapX domain-containing protein